MKDKYQIIGLLVVVIGLSLVLSWGILKFIVAAIIILLGIRMIFSKSWSNEQNVFFKTITEKPDSSEDRNYKTFFSKISIGFENLNLTNSFTLRINANASTVVLRIPQDIPYSLESNTLFGITEAGQQSSNFGTMHYKSDSFKIEEPFINIYIDSALSEVRIIKV